MMANFFNREKHIFKSSVFNEIVKDTIRFFNGTPVHSLPPPIKFSGVGVYAIYYIGKSDYYKGLYEENRLEFCMPIYIGKAVILGWRQGNIAGKIGQTYKLYNRLTEHSKSIEQAENIELSDFYCRFMILEGGGEDLVSTIEAALIRHYKPIWNTSVDGFGNHDPGSGRYNQAKSEWDILHPGRFWADKCVGTSTSKGLIEAKAKEYYAKLKGND